MNDTFIKRTPALLFASLFACIAELFCLYGITCLHSPRQMILILGSLVLTVFLGVAVYWLFLHLPAGLVARLNASLSQKLYWGVLALTFGVLLAATIHRLFWERTSLREGADYSGLLWFDIPFPFMLAVGVGCFIWLFLSLRGELRSISVDQITDNVKTFICYAFSAALYGLSAYVPNIFSVDAYHMMAATQSIYNVAHRSPITIRTSGIYGHYAIFFWPFMDKLGYRPEIVAGLIAGAGVLSELLFLYVIHRSLHSHVLRRAAALASVLPIAAMYVIYLQTYPLRMLPPAMVLAYAVWCRGRGQRPGPLKIALGYVVCALAVTWATDAGLIATIAYSAWICCIWWQSEKPFSLRMLGLYAGCIAGCIFSVVGMVGIINLYNVFVCHAETVLRACFFPFVGAGSFATDLQLELHWGNNPYLWVAALFLICAVFGLRSTFLLGHHPLGNWDLLFLFAVMGIGQSGYYWNRAAYYNLTVILPEALLCMAFLAEKMLPALIPPPERRTPVRAICAGMALSLLMQLSFLSGATLIGSSGRLLDRIQNAQYNLVWLEQLAWKVKGTVPEDTFAIGIGTQEIYALLDWDTHYYQRDVSDFFGDGVEDIYEEINSQPAILAGAHGDKLLDPDAGWKLVAHLPNEENSKFRYYIKETEDTP